MLKTLRRGALHRAHAGVYSGLKMRCMRQRIGEIACSVGLSGGYSRLRCGSVDKEPQRSGDGGIEAERDEKRHPRSIRRSGMDKEEC